MQKIWEGIFVEKKIKYEPCELETLSFAPTDVVATSGWGNFGGGSDQNTDSNGWT